MGVLLIYNNSISELLCFNSRIQPPRWHPNYQFGVVNITDDGSTVCVKMDGFAPSRGGSEPVMSFEACAPFSTQGVLGGGQASGCEIPMLPGFMYALLILCVIGTASLPCLVLGLLRRRSKMLKAVLIVLELVVLAAHLLAVMIVRDDIKFYTDVIAGSTLAQLMLLHVIAVFIWLRVYVKDRSQMLDSHHEMSLGLQEAQVGPCVLLIKFHCFSTVNHHC